MVSRPLRFNIILLPLFLAALLSGCETAEKKRSKEIATFRVYMETAPAMKRGETVAIFRAAPIEIYVERAPFLSEAHVASAKVLTNMGGFVMVVELNRDGAWLLEQYTSGNPQKHLAIRTQFGKDPVQDRWLAAPLPRQPVRDGILAFTPDADRDETDQIVFGLNNAAKAGNKNAK